MRRSSLVVGCAVLLLAVICLGQTRPDPPAGGTIMYRVTSWPSHEAPDKRYADEVGQHLNRMAAEGWRFHSTIAGQGVRMMVFERVSGR